MNRQVIFERLWLVSEKERKGRALKFGPKTLLFGGNGTGKSRITKALFWTLGCNPPKFQVGAWDPDTISGLEFTFNDKKYLVIRDGRTFGLFDESENIIIAADTIRAWEKEISEFFGFHLTLKRPRGETLSRAGMDYLTIPFYIDQDGSWGHDWDTFENLSQFSQWKKPTFQLFLGMRPNSYFAATQKRDAVRQEIKSKAKELDAQKSAFKRVAELLPRGLPSLNISVFRNELNELGRQSNSLQKKQSEIKAKLILLVNERQKISSEVALVTKARQELSADLGFLSEIPNSTLECPTCGTQHQNSFHAKLELSNDIETMSSLEAELRKKLAETRPREAKLRSELISASKTTNKIEMLLNTKRARLKLEDVMASYSKKTLDSAFHQVSRELSVAKDTLEIQESKLDREVKKFDDKNRLKSVSDYYSSQLEHLSIALNIPATEQVDNPTPGARSSSGGSSAPRSILAIHVAMLASNLKWGDTPLFPFVVDTPSQSGQDDKNLGKMIEILAMTAGGSHQIILAAERLPENINISEYSIIRNEEKMSALSSDFFEEAMSRLKHPYGNLKSKLTELNNS
ncbi:hypothetical protein [Pseudomonas caspiana]|uniref:Rad50/SbcC-type AAA domain-containing protein n=1 Tax=Pseudomonas caspiana TaxID=1451454 RepID=A0A1Y3PAB8_9PSED|nr:hypothetical protein [Pseudomonas caspiana]OUM73744.1 hypothetical protein AUC60_11780 [Pseudomonas caspiana]